MNCRCYIGDGYRPPLCIPVEHPFTVARWEHLAQLMRTQDPITVDGCFPMIVREMSVTDWVIRVVFQRVERI